MKRKYEDVQMNILMLLEDVVRTSDGLNDNPNTDDQYDLSGFTVNG